MKIRLVELKVRTKRTIESIPFSPVVTFLHGPIGRGKSTVARLVDYCLGGELERTPAIQSEFLTAELNVALGDMMCTLERAASDTQSVRVSWSSTTGEIGSINAPFSAQDQPIWSDDVFNLSDLIFHLCGVSPIKVRKRSRDPDSSLIRLSFRDVWWYSYLEQGHLDSSFYRLEDVFRGRKSQDAMRFFTGLHSERLSQLEADLFKSIDQQRGKREAVGQIRSFMNQFGWGTSLDLEAELATAERSKEAAEALRTQLEQTRRSTTHPTDKLRVQLRQLGAEIQDAEIALFDSRQSIEEQVALRAELVTAKTKSARVEQAGRILEGVHFERCPECGTDISLRPIPTDHCQLCGSHTTPQHAATSIELEALRRDLNDRIDQIADSIARRQREISRSERQLGEMRQRKLALDDQLQAELARYDSAYVENIRAAEREIATFTERVRSLHRLSQMPLAISRLEEEAGSIQGEIDRLRSEAAAERDRLRAADANIAALAAEFKRILLAVSFPGMSEHDELVIDPRNWAPVVVHGEQAWGFWDTGSGGKKTLFNVCYALALHRVAILRDLPVPNILLIDSPTKNISDDENPELVRALYDEIYSLAVERNIQFILIDSDFVEPSVQIAQMTHRRMAGTEEAPALISYYSGP